jgi:hypothetical protein
MNRNLRYLSWAVIFVFIFLFSALSLTAQKSNRRGVAPLWEDTAINPHDYTNEFYVNNGVNPKQIIGRRTGSDGLSVFSNSSNPNHTNVRVIATVPAYNQNGETTFWYPLGELQDNGFTEDKVGVEARQIAGLFPIYIFPDNRVASFYAFANSRQAPIIDNSWSTYAPNSDLNPLGIREIFIVNYTEKALGKEGVEMIEFFGKKNGLSTDDTPIIKSSDDIQYLAKNEFIRLDSLKLYDDRPFRGQYAIAPVITDPTKGSIAKDAFIWMATKDDKPLSAEAMFVWQFGCLQKTGEWCK